jgi:hypothetical protein
MYLHPAMAAGGSGVGRMSGSVIRHRAVRCPLNARPAFPPYAAAQTQFSSVDVLQGNVASSNDVGQQIGTSGKMRWRCARWESVEPSKSNPAPGGRGHPSTSASNPPFVHWFLLWLLRTAIVVAVLAHPRFSAAADGIEELLRETHWGESSSELLRQFGDEAERLPRALDFGDSYADIVLTRQTLGGVPMVVFLQMDKATHGLKRIQLERPRHAVNPPSFRAIAGALNADYGKPDQTCVIPVLPASGYQAAAEERWTRDGVVINAIFRDTTLQAFEGCLFGPGTGWCGLQGQLLVRIGPPDGSADPCSLTLPRGAAPR